MATVYFMQRVIDLTQAHRDQDHINMVVKQHASIPDRTAFLLGQSKQNPLPVMVGDARELEEAGASFIAMPCNTAHYFYDELQAAVDIPFVNIVEEAIAAAMSASADLSLVGVLATDGTVRSGTYERACRRLGLTCLAPAPHVQDEVMDIIYEGVKAGRPVPKQRLEAVIAHLRDRGCQAVVLGCTELSVLGHQHGMPGDVIDSLDVLARRTIELCGKSVTDQ